MLTIEMIEKGLLRFQKRYAEQLLNWKEAKPVPFIFRAANFSWSIDNEFVEVAETKENSTNVLKLPIRVFADLLFQLNREMNKDAREESLRQFAESAKGAAYSVDAENVTFEKYEGDPNRP